MFKQNLVATVVVFILWSLIDFLVHGLMLQSVYQDTAALWRPENLMYPLLMSAVTLFFCFCVVIIYSALIAPKSLQAGFKYGLLLGLGIGVLTGVGSYAYMPIPLYLAGAWFAIYFVKLALAGVVAGYMVKEPATPVGATSY